MELTSFQTGILILGGDFNIALEDTGTSLMPYRAPPNQNPTTQSAPTQHLAHLTPR